MLTTASWRGGIGQSSRARFGDCVANGACCRQILGLNATELDKGGQPGCDRGGLSQGSVDSRRRNVISTGVESIRPHCASLVSIQAANKWLIGELRPAKNRPDVWIDEATALVDRRPAGRRGDHHRDLVLRNRPIPGGSQPAPAGYACYKCAMTTPTTEEQRWHWGEGTPLSGAATSLFAI